MRGALALLVLCLACLLPRMGMAHALEPGFLELQPLGAGDWRVTWRKPQVGGAPMAIDARLPQGCDPQFGPDPIFDGRAFLSRWISRCEAGIAGGEIRIEGLERTQTDVLLRYGLAPGERLQTARLTAAAPAVTIPDQAGFWGLTATYFRLGMDHILNGIDHLLFVLMLLLLIRDWRPLLAAITAFTIAHSLSLAAASLGLIFVPAPPVEAIVALSIAFLAAELLQHSDQHPSLTARHPWAVAFAFGLLHGLGFARALLELGLPQGDVPLALLAFNLGVEAGQILFILGMLGLGAAFARLYPIGATRLMRRGGPGLRLVAYCLGTLAAYWVIERVAGFVA